MKFTYSKTILFVLLLLWMAPACNKSAKSVKGTTSYGKEASVDVEVFDAVKIKDQLVELIQKAPDFSEIANLLNEAGASYIMELTVPHDQSEKFMTTTELALGLGMYAFDYQYAKTYNRMEVVSQITRLEKPIIDKLDLTKGIATSEEYVEKLKESANIKDSIDQLVTQAINISSQKIASSEHPDVYSLAFIAANVEGLYILTQLTLFAKDNTQLLKIMSDQQERAKSVFSLLELMSGEESVKPYYDQMAPIAKYFEKHPKIGTKQVKEIAPMVEKLRNSML